MLRPLIVCSLAALVLVGCGEQEKVKRPAVERSPADRLTVGEGQTAIPTDWQRAPKAVQDTLEQRLGQLPSAEVIGLEPKTPQPNNTTLVISVFDPKALGAEGGLEPDDDEKTARDIVAGAKDGLRAQKISGARFLVSDTTLLAGTKAFPYEVRYDDPDRGEVVVRALISGRDGRAYSVQADGPKSDASRMRDAIARVRRAWSWRPE